MKSPAEIFAALDGDSIDRMPFRARCSNTRESYTVARRVDRIWDTVTATGNRRMKSTVYLDDLRFDGSAHGGCQAGCRLYWKEAWLRRVDGRVDVPAVRQEPAPVFGAVLKAGAHTVRDGEERWRRQNTESVKSGSSSRHEPRCPVGEVSAGHSRTALPSGLDLV